MVTANVDIPALKARHPLGDTVEAAGVRLRGRGRVRQGVCPFHDENEGSFTVYADSERFYCFGCGEGGDVLDFIQRAEGLSLPEAIARLDGSPGLAPRAATRPAGTRRPRSAALPPRDPALLTAAARFYAGRLRRCFRSAGVPGLAGRRPGRRSPPRSRLCAGQRAAAGSLESLWLLREAHPGLRAVHGAGSGAVRRHGRRPRRLRRPRPLARRAGHRPRPDTPLPGSSRPQAGAWARATRPAPPWEVVAEGVFDWLALTGWGLPILAALGTQGVERVASALRGCPRVFLAFDADDAGREATERLLTLLGRRAAAVALPPGVGDVGELAALPHGRTAFLRLLSQAARSAR